MSGPTHVAGLTGLLLLVWASSGTAQGWTVDAYAGRAVHEPVAASVGTSNGVLNLRYAGAGTGWSYLSAGLPFGAPAPSWGAIGLGDRLSLESAHLSAGVDVAAHGFGYRHPSLSTTGAGITLQALPYAAVEQGPVRFEVHSGVTGYGSAFSGQTTSRMVHDTGARLALRGGFPVELTAEARNVRAEEDNYSYAGGSASLSHGSTEIWASLGQWFSDAIPDVSWGAGMTVALGPRFAVWGAIRQESTHPVYWNSPRQSWNIGVSHRLGQTSRAPAPVPVPTEVAAGYVTIRVSLAEASDGLFVAGDFTDWDPVAMVRSGEQWTLTVAVEPGVHYYAFRAADGRWFVPRSVPGRRDDGFGGHVAILLVP